MTMPLAAMRMQRRLWLSTRRRLGRMMSTDRAPSELYAERVESGQLTADPAQRRVIARHLDRLHQQLRGYRLPDLEAQGETAARVPRGLYVHGHVGTGKSMLMDLFFELAPVERKRRVHFNKFMLDVHQRLQRVKLAQLATFGRERNINLDPRRDAISLVATELVEESHLLCFDEFQVTDIADAMILRKLFGVFFGRGGVMVATSNTAPKDLYKDGTNYEYFVPFLEQLARHNKIVDMESVLDYRSLAQKPLGRSMFLSPLSPETSVAMDDLVEDLLDEEEDEGEDERERRSALASLRVPVMMGRHLDVLGTRSGVARVSFDAMCNTEKGAADYKALSECFHTVVLDGVPRLDMKAHDQTRRFILLIDELYEHRARLVCSAEVPLEAVFHFDGGVLDGAAEALELSERGRQAQLDASKSHGIPASTSWDAAVGAYNPAKMPGLQVDNLCAMKDLQVAFRRAVSRLREMQSEKYLALNAALRPTRRQRLQDVVRP
ncbi:hypothetical protein ATCC90586_005236 [Pythium insidiosum]|nr:hypothetical protein ATCC90586_005236 [Pythium insidiosum]